MTIADLSNRTGLPIGMLPKIENGNTSPALSILQTLANAKSVPLTSFVRRFEDAPKGANVSPGFPCQNRH